MSPSPGPVKWCRVSGGQDKIVGPPLTWYRVPLTVGHHHVSLHSCHESRRTERIIRSSAICIHASSNCAAGGVVHYHQGQRYVSGRFYLLLGPDHSSARRRGPEPSARCAPGCRNAHCTRPLNGDSNETVLTACRGRSTKVLALRERSAAFPFCARARCVSLSLHSMSYRS